MNLQYVKSWLDLPLRTHLWHATVLTTLAVVMLVVSNSFYREVPNPNPPRPIPGDLSKGRVLILGTSQLMGLQESDFDMPVLNRSVGGSSFTIFKSIFDSFEPRMPELETVIISFDNISLRTPAVGRRKGDYRDVTAAGVPWHRLNFISPPERLVFYIRYCTFLSPFFIGPKLDLERLVRWESPLIHAQIRRPDDKGIYDVGRGFSVPVVDGWKKMDTYVTLLSRDHEMDRNTRAFREIMTVCARRNISVIGVNAPTTPSFGRSLPLQWRRDMLNLLSHCRASVPALRLHFWDADAALGLPLECFGDPNHLNLEGNQRFAAWLKERLHLDEPPDDADGFAVPDPNLILSADPRESCWQWLPHVKEPNRLKYEQIEPAHDPAEFPAPRSFAMRLAPGQSLIQVSKTIVQPGETYRAALSLSADTRSTSGSLQLRLVSQSGAPVEEVGMTIDRLTTQAHTFHIDKRFEQSHSGLVFQLSNKSSTEREFLFSEPTLVMISHPQASRERLP